MRSSSLRWTTIVSLALASLSAPVLVFAAGTEGKPATSAAAKPATSASAGKPSDKPDAGVADAGSSDGGLGPVDGSTLPPGHPAIGGDDDEDGDEMPEGHPQIGNNPHGGDNPHGAVARNGFYEAPPDTAIDDPSLPPGTIVVTIKDADDKPIPKASAVIGILESSVARGDSRSRKTVEMDAEGTAQVDGLVAGSNTSYRISTIRDGGSFASEPFNLSPKAGKRVVLHAYQSSTNLDDTLVIMHAFLIVSLREDSLEVQNQFDVFNVGKTAWVPDSNGAKLVMPDSYKAFNTGDNMADVRFVEGKQNVASLTGTIAPGQAETFFSYQVPLQNAEQQTIHIALPPRVREVRVVSESGKSLGLDVAGFPAAQKQRGQDGRKFWITGRQVERDERGIQTLDITISGLPTPGIGRWIAVLCAFSALGLLGFFFYQQDKDVDAHDDIRRDLVEARDALLGEFVTLEKAHRKGDVGPKTYQRVKTALLDALARIEARLDEMRAEKTERKRQNRSGRAEARGEGGAS